MVGDLLKELFPALGRFIGYHCTRVLKGQDTRAMAVEPVLSAKVIRSVPPPPNSPTDSPMLRPSGAEIRVETDNVGLDPAFERTVQWPCYRTDDSPPDLVTNDFYRLWTTIPAGNKWTHYFSVYQAIFESRRAEPLRVLEIGIFQGGSLKLWRKYFEHPQTVIVGIDITPDCMAHDAPERGVYVRIGSQADPIFLKNVVDEFGPFDLIIDDGSHYSSHIIFSFNHLYFDGLKESGIYVVEDLHANYWTPWRDTKKGFLDVCKELVEHMNAHYKSASPWAFLVDHPAAQPQATIDVPAITTMIREVRFFDSIVAIYKAPRPYVPHRVRTGATSESR